LKFLRGKIVTSERYSLAGEKTRRALAHRATDLRATHGLMAPAAQNWACYVRANLHLNVQIERGKCNWTCIFGVEAGWRGTFAARQLLGVMSEKNLARRCEAFARAKLNVYCAGDFAIERAIWAWKMQLNVYIWCGG
jgi:hypothetical protein